MTPGLQLQKNTNWMSATLNSFPAMIPDGWEIAQLENLGKTITGNTPSTTEPDNWESNPSEGGVRWISTPDLRVTHGGVVASCSKRLTRTGALKARIAPAGTVLVSCIATIGEVGVIGEPSTFNQQINGVLPSEAFNSHYLKHYLTLNRENLRKYAPASVVAIINKKDFGQFECLMPPLVTQARVASVLSKQEQVISDIKALVNKLETRQRYFSRELLSGRLRVREVESTRLLYRNETWQDINVNGDTKSIPLDWSVNSLGRLGGFRSGQDHKRCPGLVYPVYGSSATPMPFRAAKCTHPGGTFIIGRKGTIDKPFYLKDAFWCVDTALYFDARAEVSAKFIYFIAKSSIDWLSLNSGSTVPSLVQSDVNAIEVVLPCPAEQILIVQTLAVLENDLELHKQLLAVEQKKFQWLLDNLMTGKYLLKECP